MDIADSLLGAPASDLSRTMKRTKIWPMIYIPKSTNQLTHLPKVKYMMGMITWLISMKSDVQEPVDWKAVKVGQK